MTFLLGQNFAIGLKQRQNMFFNKNNAFKRNTSLFYFFIFFRANVFQVKLDNILFLFKFNLTSHELSDDQIPSALFTKFKKKQKVNT